MNLTDQAQQIMNDTITGPDHSNNDYFKSIKALVKLRNEQNKSKDQASVQNSIDAVYEKILDEIITNDQKPRATVKFGTSGWRGILGKDLFIRSVASVCAAILSLYKSCENNEKLQEALGIQSFQEMQERGCVVGFDNRFGGSVLALSICNVLAANGIKIYYAGESTTGAISASVLERKSAFSVNLTPSHNPLEYGGFKYNGADAGPAAPILTNIISEQARIIIDTGKSEFLPQDIDLQRPLEQIPGVVQENALLSWQNLVLKNFGKHAIRYDELLCKFERDEEIFVAVDCVHGASRNNILDLFKNPETKRLQVLRDNNDYTFGGIAPEPSSANMIPVLNVLAKRSEKFKLGAIIDPDGDRIRFTDGIQEISMNQFGAMAYHFIHEIKGKKGLVAKTVATSNLANSIAKGLGEETFEPKVGFKEFKPVMGKALVYFEESDGISVIGHTPEKDAYIGLILALDMIMTLRKNLSEYLHDIENEFGAFYPDRDGVTVSQQGNELTSTLARLEKYSEGSQIQIGSSFKTIAQVIDIDGRKMLLQDGSWIMIRPSGTEPKVRFYVEARNAEDTKELVNSAKSMLAEIGLLA